MSNKVFKQKSEKLFCLVFRPYLVGYFNCGVYKLAVVASIERHTVVPEMFEEVWQNLIHYVLRLHTVCTATLFHYLKEYTL